MLDKEAPVLRRTCIHKPRKIYCTPPVTALVIRDYCSITDWKWQSWKTLL